MEGGQGVCERTSKGDELDSEGGLQVNFHYNNLFDKHLLKTDLAMFGEPLFINAKQVHTEQGRRRLSDGRTLTGFVLRSLIFHIRFRHDLSHHI